MRGFQHGRRNRLKRASEQNSEIVGKKRRAAFWYPSRDQMREQLAEAARNTAELQRRRDEAER